MTTNKLDEIEGRHNHDAKYQFSHDVRCYGFEPDVGIQAHEDRAYLLSRVRELEAALEASENKARGYQNIAGACLSGTNEADKILEENPPTGFNWSNAWSAAYKSHTASRDATIAACIKTIKEERDRLRAILDAPVTEEMVTAARDALVYTGYNDETQKRVIHSQAGSREYIRGAIEAALAARRAK